MESPQNLKKRLKSVKNINQITKAMELVSATKMRKSQQIALDSRPYALSALELLANISALSEISKVPMPELFLERKIKKVLFVLVASDKGLAGAFNSSVFKKFEQHLKQDAGIYQKEEKLFLSVGEKSFQYLSKKGFVIVKKFVQVGDQTTLAQIHPVADFIMQGYLEKTWDRVVIISTHFTSALKQDALVRTILPIDFDHIKETIEEVIPERGKFANIIKEQHINFIPDRSKVSEYLIEPSAQIVLDKLSKHLLVMELYQLILEANASEHSARRLAMKTASDNANDLGLALNLEYNKSRQARITTEIAEISAGAESLN